MLKMAYAPLPKLMCKPIDTSKMCPTSFAKPTLSDVLQSDPVKRLFNQPNIIIKTIPLKLHTTSATNNNVLIDKRNSLTTGLSNSQQPSLSVIPIDPQEDYTEEETLLPSKREGKSEIALVPIKREKKSCGHYEACENIICDVMVQQYVDHNGASPMLATNIEEDEINAPVSKHCKNERCDALSIDHNRCRRVMIKLYRYDQTKACDICGITLKTRKSRVYHNNCTRMYEYRHNETDGAQILKERMREREIQMIEASKVKKNNYLDPIVGHSLAMEALKNNEELIVIPKSVPVQQPTITITSVPATQSGQQMNNVNNVLGKLLPSIPIVLPQQSIVLGKSTCSGENGTSTVKQMTLSDTLSRSFITTTNTIPLPNSQFIKVGPQSGVQPITINDLLLSQTHIVTSTPIQPKPFLTPVRVVPITNLITQPSLLHQTQGIPKFCIMPDNGSALTISSPQPVLSPAPVPNVVVEETYQPPVEKKKKLTIKKKRRLKKKDFNCNYCFKSFSTDWYFKMHVAMHEGQKRFTCKICAESFNNRYDLKRHMMNDHKEDTPDDKSTEESYKCSDCDIVYTSMMELMHHREKCHGKTESDDHIASVSNGNEELEEKDEDNTSDEATDTEVPAKITKIRKNSLEVIQKAEATGSNKINGFVCIPVENGVKDIKLKENPKL